MTNPDISVETALRARLKSFDAEARVLRERVKECNAELVTLRRAQRQHDHVIATFETKLETRTVRIRRLEAACKIELKYLRDQDSEGLWWCSNPKDRHRSGEKGLACGRCSVTNRVTDALAGKYVANGID